MSKQTKSVILGFIKPVRSLGFWQNKDILSQEQPTHLVHKKITIWENVFKDPKSGALICKM